jgi:uncharacterized membrane protein
MSNPTFADVRMSVKESMSSIFTREDVLRIVDKLEAALGTSTNSDFEDIKEAVRNVLSCIQAVNDIDTSDIEDIELSISGREVCVDSLEIVGLDNAMIDLRLACQDLCKSIDDSF